MASAKIEEARMLAMEKGLDLFPHDCIEILEGLYGNRLKKMKPSTIFNIVLEMMRLATDANIEDDIHEAISDWL